MPPQRRRTSGVADGLLLRHAHRISKEEKNTLIIRRQYDPHNHTKNVLQFRGTVLQLLAFSAAFWSLNILNTVVFLSWRYLASKHKERVLELWHLHINYMQPMGSLVVFAIVFYTGNCYIVYKDLFNFGCRLRRKISAWSVDLKSVLRTPGSDAEWRCVRHMLAAQRTFYFEMKKKMAEHHGYTTEDGILLHPGTFADFAEKHLVQKGLLLKEEVNLLAGFRGSKLLLLSSWSQSAFMEVSAVSHHFKILSPPMQSQFLRHCLDTNSEVQELLDGTKDTVHFGVPFVYHHVVHCLVWIYLVLLPFATVFVQGGEPSYWTLIT